MVDSIATAAPSALAANASVRVGNRRGTRRGAAAAVVVCRSSSMKRRVKLSREVRHQNASASLSSPSSHDHLLREATIITALHAPCLSWWRTGQRASSSRLVKLGTAAASTASAAAAAAAGEEEEEEEERRREGPLTRAETFATLPLQFAVIAMRVFDYALPVVLADAGVSFAQVGGLLVAGQAGNVVGKFVHGPLTDAIRPTTYQAILAAVEAGCVVALSCLDVTDDALLFAGTWGLLRFCTGGSWGCAGKAARDVLPAQQLGVFTGAVSGVSALATVCAGFALSAALGGGGGAAAAAAGGGAGVVAGFGGVMTWREAFRWGAGALGAGALAMAALAKRNSGIVGTTKMGTGKGTGAVVDDDVAGTTTTTTAAAAAAAAVDRDGDGDGDGDAADGDAADGDAAAAADGDGDAESGGEDFVYALKWSVGRVVGSPKLMGFTLAQGCSWCVYEMVVFLPLIGGTHL